MRGALRNGESASIMARGGFVRDQAARLTEVARRCSLALLLVAVARDDSGQDFVEYALTAAIVVLGLLLALFGFQVVVELVLNQVCDGVDTAAGLHGTGCINPQ